jgi:hypothetical protein
MEKKMTKKLIVILAILTLPLIACSKKENPLSQKRSPADNKVTTTKHEPNIIAEKKQNLIYNNYQSDKSTQNSKKVVDYIQQYQLENKRAPIDNSDLISEMHEADRIYSQLKESNMLDESNKHLVNKHKKIKSNNKNHKNEKKELSKKWNAASPKKSKNLKKANSNLNHLILPKKKQPNPKECDKPAAVNENAPKEANITAPVANNTTPKETNITAPVVNEAAPKEANITAPVVNEAAPKETEITAPVVNEAAPKETEITAPVVNEPAPKMPPFPSSSMIEHKIDFMQIFSIDKFIQMLDNLKIKLINFFVSLI